MLEYSHNHKTIAELKVWHETWQTIIVEKQPALEEEKWVITKIENNNLYYSVLPEEAYNERLSMDFCHNYNIQGGCMI